MSYEGIGPIGRTRNDSFTDYVFNPYLFEMSGQSNLGAAIPSSGIPGDLSGDITGVEIFNLLDDTWGVLNCTVNSACMIQDVTNDRYGVEMRLGKLMRAYYGQTIYIIKYGSDGSILYPEPSNSWDPITVGQLFTTSNTHHDLALSSLGDARPPKFFLWIQGEADAQSTTPSFAYENNLRKFIAYKRSSIGYPVPFVIVRLGDNQTQINATRLAVVRDAQEKVADDIYNYLVDADGLACQGDNVHYTAASIDTLAERIFDVIITIP